MKIQYNDKDVTDNAKKDEATSVPDRLYLTRNVCEISTDDSSTDTV